MTQAMNKSQLAILIVLLLFVTATDESGVREKSAFVNHTVALTFCSPNFPSQYKINGQSHWELPFKEEIEFRSDEDSCHHLTFPARPEYDNATVTFLLNDGTEINFLLRVQGVLSSPSNFTYQDLNSTHITITWDKPFSHVKPANITYVLILQGTDTKNITLTARNYTMFRPPGTLIAVLTPWNPVGEGKNITLDLSFDECEKHQDEITPVASPYQREGQISVSVELFTLQENVKYCVPDKVTVAHSNGEEMAYDVIVNNEKAYFIIPNVPEEQLVADTLIWYNSTSDLRYSTYKVQDVSVRDDPSGEGQLVQCYFLGGTSDNTCFIEVDGRKKPPLSGSDRYTVTEPGNHTLRVYDSRNQKDRQIDPAKVVHVNISKEGQGEPTDDPPTDKDGKEGFPWGILGGALGGVLGVVALLVLGLVVGILCFKKRRSGRHDPSDMPMTLQETRTETSGRSSDSPTDTQLSGPPVDYSSSDKSIHEAIDEDKTEMEIGKGNNLTRRRILRPNAQHRNEGQNHVAISMEGISCDKLSTMVLPTHETGQVTSYQEKQVEVDMNDLPTIELHGAPVDEIAA